MTRRRGFLTPLLAFRRARDRARRLARAGLEVTEQELRASIPGYAEHADAVAILNAEGITDDLDRQARYDQIVGRFLHPWETERLRAMGKL